MRAALLCLVLLAGCKETNPYYCPEYDNNLCPQGGDGMQMDCEKSSDCTTSGAMVCKLPEKVCVQCTPMEKTACGGQTPVCANDVCRACTKHADCPSNACMPDGSCAESVAYVAPNGSGTACMMGTPCNSLAVALATGRPAIKFATGITMGDTALVTITGKTVTIVAEPGAEYKRSGSTGPQLLVQGASTNVTVSDLTFSGNTNDDGIDLSNTGGSPTLVLKRVTIKGNDGFAISTTGGDLTLTQSELTANRNGALSLNSNTTFKIVNNVIFGNGATNAPGAAVEINGSATTDVFEFNTITGNTTADTKTTGMACFGSASVRNNIIWLNIDANPTTTPIKHWDGSCTISSSIVGPSNPPAGGTDTDPMLDSNRKLMTGSPALNAAMTATPMTGLFAVDFEGESRPRPANEKADLGADEAP